MKANIASLILILVCSINVLTILGTVSASPENWSEVVRFHAYEDASFTTDNFTCHHVDWRIRWSYVADGYPFESLLAVEIFEAGESERLDLILKMGYYDDYGVKFIHNNNGTFYFKMTIANVDEYLVIVEQDLDSVPEFSSQMVLPLFMIATLLAALVYRRRRLKV